MATTRVRSQGLCRIGVWLAGGVIVLASAGVQAGGGGHGGHRGHGGHGHSSFGFYFGGPIGPPLWGPRYWGPHYWGPPGYWYDPYPRYPGVVVVPAPQPPVYIQQAPPVASAPPPGQQQNVWYWCAQANGYYPYVQDCPGGWQAVAPTPPPR